MGSSPRRVTNFKGMPMYMRILFSDFGSVFFMFIMAVCLIYTAKHLYTVRTTRCRITRIECQISVAVAMILFTIFGVALMLTI